MNVLIAESCPILRRWLSIGVGGTVVREAESGWRALSLLAEETFHLVITAMRLPDLPGPALMGMVRTVGLPVPFILISRLPSAAVQAAVRQLAPAAILTDWWDTSALRGLRDELCGSSEPRAAAELTGTASDVDRTGQPSVAHRWRTL